MPRKGENIYKRKDGRWEGRYIKARSQTGKAVYGLSKREFDVKDKIITLSTCTGNEATRYVVQAVKVEPG